MKIFYIFIICFKILFLQGCTTIAVSSIAAIAAKSIVDPRTIGTQFDDNTLELRVINVFRQDPIIKRYARIIPTVYQNQVLLTGQAMNKEIVDHVTYIVTKTPGVNKVYNEIRITKNSNLLLNTKDLLITTKIRAKLLGNKNIKSSNIKVVTENSEVFLLGFVTYKESIMAADIASQINGVKQVFTMFILY